MLEIYEHTGGYGDNLSYVMKSLEDFDEYEKTLGKEYINKYNPNFYSFKEDFKKYINKFWADTDDIRYMVNGEPIYTIYKIIGIEDDNANCDWYWVLESTIDKGQIRKLANDAGFYNDIINDD